jgi:hypothetical protein
MEDKFLLPYIDGMASVITTLKTNDQVGLLRHHIDDLALTLVAPLYTDEHCDCHGPLRS